MVERPIPQRKEAKLVKSGHLPAATATSATLDGFVANATYTSDSSAVREQEDGTMELDE
jgi:hypothetical protein